MRRSAAGSDWTENALFAGIQAICFRQGGIAIPEVLGSHHVTVMQSTESRQRDDLFSAGRLRHRNSTSGRALPQPEMSPVFVIIENVFFQQSSQVSLVQNDHMVEQVPTHTPDPTLSDAVGEGRQLQRMAT